VDADPGQLRQALVNLVENAVQATSPRGEVRISGVDAPGPQAAAVVLSVEDDGPGVDDSVRGRLFEPLVTTKARGIGLGLALVKRVAERHGGSVAYEPRPGGGARFTLRLPRS
jgi:signal transduction histidine kinase